MSQRCQEETLRQCSWRDEGAGEDERAGEAAFRKSFLPVAAQAQDRHSCTILQHLDRKSKPGRDWRWKLPLPSSKPPTKFLSYSSSNLTDAIYLRERHDLPARSFRIRSEQSPHNGRGRPREGCTSLGRSTQKVNVWAGGIHVPPVFSWQTSPDHKHHRQRFPPLVSRRSVSCHQRKWG
jgi:hypothetical protein